MSKKHKKIHLKDFAVFGCSQSYSNRDRRRSSREKTEDTIDDCYDMIAEHKARVAAMTGGSTEYKPLFDVGLGLDVSPGKDPRLYRLTEPEEELNPHLKLDSVRLEASHKRGYGIRFGFKKTK